MKYFFQDEHHYFMALEYCPGGELFKHIKDCRTGRPRLSMKAVKFYSACIVNSLEILHQNKIVYKDLKPENIVISKDGFPKLTDFGLCIHEFPGATPSEQFNRKKATLHITAPEILRKSQFSSASDYWSLGCFIYELIVGKPPFYDELSTF